MARRSLTSARPPRPEVLAFLREIKDNPDDNTPRLVLADWLEEHDDPRGELIRLQCRRARPGPELALLERHRDEWLGVLAEKGIICEFRRGLVKVTGGARKLLSKRMAALPPAEALAWVDHLYLYDMNAEAVTKLAQSPHWTCLTSLDLSGTVYYADHLVRDHYTVGIGREGAIGLTSVPALSHLSELRLWGNDIGAEGIAVLAASPNLSRLRSLDLSSNNLRDDGASALASSRSLTSLVELCLNQNRIGAGGFAALARWPGLSRLKTLWVSGNYPGPEGAAALAASPHLGRLTELHMRAEALGSLAGLEPYQIGPEGAVALSHSSTLKRLAILQLSGNGVGDEGAIALASSPTLSRLARLDLCCNEIGDRGALALASSPFLARLKYLNFRANRGAGPAALTALRDRFGDGLDTEQLIP
jgi:uncharacterized protein (TIGR02996 family)